MPDAITSQIDIVIYLVPGYLVLLAAVFAHAPDRIRATREKLGAGEILASVIAALLLGIAIHRIAAVVPLAS